MMPVSMVGRAGELGEFTRAWTGVVTGHGPPAGVAAPRTVVLTGEAGVGKSRLVAAALDALAPRPPLVLSGTARVHSPAPYDWLAAVLTGHDADALPLPSDALAWLAQHPTAPRERYAPATLLRLAVRTVRLLVGAGPAVLVVEDLHALDPASLNLVGELATAAELPVLLVVASRPPEVAVSPQLTARTLARLAGTPGTVRQHLGPLSPAEVAEILAQVYATDDPLPAGAVDAVWRRTGGNPYLVTELLAAVPGHDPAALLAVGPPTGVAMAGLAPAGAVSAGLAPVGGSVVVPTPTEPGRVAPTDPSASVSASASASVELTAREREVLGCLTAGMSNKQVARALSISVRTVAVHVSNLLRKTGTASRTEAALWALRNPRAAPAPQPVAPAPPPAQRTGGDLDGQPSGRGELVEHG
ncbi:LuxR C-terminal-related transcriptional regulator [Plantactinospora siamensis]|uniref:LuxR C-terminal-related transcriptional regulator n=1 Tax=Plantactinospora siamensis TaxID=555372 RepID=A0ABV6NSI5_9ACTN